MKGVILAGGSGTRLRPITYTTQKQLIPIANKPVVQHVIEDLRSVGITEIGIVIGGQFPGDVKNFLGDGDNFDVEITYIVQGEPLGLAHAVGCAQDFVGDEPFVVYFGDTILGDSVTKSLVRSFDPSVHDAGLALQRVETPSRFGIADIENGTITRILEKPEDPPTNLAYIGVLACTSTVFQYIEALEPSWRGELELTQALHEIAVDGNNIQWEIIDDLWKDVGTPEDVIETNRKLLEDLEQDIQGSIPSGADVTAPVQLGKGGVVESSATVQGPVIIGEDTVVRSGAHVGPYTSIGDDCTIKDSHVRSSVVMDHSEITGDVRLEDSLIAEQVTIDQHNNTGINQYIVGRDTIINGR